MVAIGRYKLAGKARLKSVFMPELIATYLNWCVDMRRSSSESVDNGILYRNIRNMHMF
jgi:hypothetical protein